MYAIATVFFRATVSSTAVLKMTAMTVIDIFY